MAKQRKNSSKQNGLPSEPFFLFDRESADHALIGGEQPRWWQRLAAFLRSRYAILAFIFLAAGSLIFAQTAALQFRPLVPEAISGESEGLPRQLVLPAARGDILDADGVPIAWSAPVGTLLLARSDQPTAELNRMLLDLSLYLEAHDVNWNNELAVYLDWDNSALANASGGGQLVYRKPIEEILAWQGRGGVFSLEPEQPDKPASYRDNRQTREPTVFYQYLLYTLFRVEDPQAALPLYSREEAWRIVSLRYLIYKNNWTFQRGVPIELARHIPESVMRTFQEQNYRFPGVLISRDYERVYADNARLFSHLLGYVGRITAQQYESMQKSGYAMDAIVGQAGVELGAERYLAGQPGIKPYNVFLPGEASRNSIVYREDIGREPVRGANVRLTLNARLQAVARDSLISTIETIRSKQDEKRRGDANAGAVIMLDVRSGAVLAMVSYPDYDPNDFNRYSIDPAAKARVQAYQDDQNHPLWNRAIMSSYSPGSTYKPLTAVAALETGRITVSNTTLVCRGKDTIGGVQWSCLEKPIEGHGPMTLLRGLATSCNLYFFQLGIMTGIDHLDQWGRKFSLGEYTDIDLPGEARGIRPNRAYKQTAFSNPSDQIWFVADTCQTAIGQQFSSYTMIQLATYTAGLATGNKVTPYVIDEITRTDGTIISRGATTPVPLGLSPDTLRAVREGMVAVTTDVEGTAQEAFQGFLPGIQVAAKTGTAETGSEDDSSSNGLFICYAPADNPQVAIAQIVEKGAWGSNTISIARDLLVAYFAQEGQRVSKPYQPGVIHVPTPSPSPSPSPIPSPTPSPPPSPTPSPSPSPSASKSSVTGDTGKVTEQTTTTHVNVTSATVH